jgi:hypothetical protein
VRRELGPEAVIVQTRSLLRDGADPLIEVLASLSDGGEDTLTLALQRALVQGSLERVETPTASRGLTIGDLEDIATRSERDAVDDYAPRQRAEDPRPEPATQPGWLEGYVATPGKKRRDDSSSIDHVLDPSLEPALDTLEPFDLPPVAPPTPIEWSPRPQISRKQRQREAPPLEMPVESEAPGPRRFAPVEPGLAGRLVAAGFSSDAARRIEAAAPGARTPQEALEAALAAAEVLYPSENRTAIITIQGAPGSGRTTALMRMALDCADSGREAILVAADSSHTGGRAQVHAYAEAIGIPVFDAFGPQDVVQAVTRAPKGACIFIDVPAGSWSPPPIPGVAHFVYLAVPAHWQTNVIESELSEFEPASCAGAILTGVDLAGSLLEAISLLIESQLGIAFLSSGRDVGTGIAVADPFTLASGVFTTSTRETTNGRLAVTA